MPWIRLYAFHGDAETFDEEYRFISDDDFIKESDSAWDCWVLENEFEFPIGKYEIVSTMPFSLWKQLTEKHERELKNASEACRELQLMHTHDDEKGTECEHGSFF